MHVSKVRSTSMDKWSEENVAFMEKIGNSRANAYWEANVPPGAKPTASEEGDPAVAKYIEGQVRAQKVLRDGRRGARRRERRRAQDARRVRAQGARRRGIGWRRSGPRPRRGARVAEEEEEAAAGAGCSSGG